MKGEMQITIRVAELPNGGFVIGEEIDGSDQDERIAAMQACTSLDEACGAIQRRLRSWNEQARIQRARPDDDESGTVIAPRKWWRAVK